MEKDCELQLRKSAIAQELSGSKQSGLAMTSRPFAEFSELTAKPWDRSLSEKPK